MNPTLNNLVLEESLIPYVVIRKRKRHLSFRFLETTLVVSAPLRMTYREIEEGLRTKKDWILQQYAIKQAEVLPKDQIRLLGKVVNVRFVKGASQKVALTDYHLVITHRSSQSEKAALAQALSGLAENEITSIFHEACRRTGFAPQTMKLKNLRSSLGRCSSTRHIILATRLIHYPSEVILAVCYHELAHLNHMNHSKSFYRQLEGWMPDYRKVMRNARNYPSVSAID